MSEKKLPELDYNYNLLARAKAGIDFLKQGDKRGVHLAKKSLEKNLKEIGRDDEWLKNTLTNDETISNALENQLKTFGKYREQDTVKNILDYYNEGFKKYIGDNGEQAQEELEQLSDKKYSEIRDEYKKAEHILKGHKEHSIGSEKDKENAEKTMKKYQNVLTTIDVLEDRDKEKFKYEVEEDFAKEIFGKMYSAKDDYNNSAKAT